MQAEVLIAREGQLVARHQLSVGQQLLLGSGADATAPLQDPLVSPRHLGLELRPDGVWATDLASATGSFLAGRPLPHNRAVGVPAGATLQVGGHAVLVRPLAPAAAAGGIRAEYESLGELGKGAAGAVFRARHRASGREVAIKLLHEQVDPIERERFLREGAVCRRIQSPHVITVYETRVEGAAAFTVMELVAGGSLEQRLAAGPLAIPEAIRIAGCIASALAAAHAVGVIHRDIKPANVLLTAGGDVKVGDFGLAKDTQSLEQLTRTREGMGTLAYLAPEQAEDSKRVDARADLYGLGSVLYHMVAGRPPFVTVGMDVLAEVLEVDPDPVQDHRPDCPDALAELIRWLLEKDPDDRPPSAEFVLGELGRAR